LDHSSPPPRNTLLAVVLSLLVVAGFSVFLMIITGGFFIYVLAVIGGIVVLGYLNYLLWGRSLSREVTGQRQEEEARGEREDWPFEEWQDPRQP
jgi:hypothetical protein